MRIKYPEARVEYVGDIEIEIEVSAHELYKLQDMMQLRNCTPLLTLILKNGDDTATFNNLTMDSGWVRG